MIFTRKTIGLLISIVEWYDFAIYAMFIKEITKSFFNNYATMYAGLYSFLILSVAYLFRPIGAYIFGQITDICDENRSLQISLFMMAISSLLVCTVPENNIIGIIILVLVRIIQGIAMGGCYGMSYVYVVANTEENKNYAASFICIGFILGFIMGQMMNVLLGMYTDHSFLAQYGWRLAFMLGALMSLCVIQMIGYKRDENYCNTNQVQKSHTYKYMYQMSSNENMSRTNIGYMYFITSILVVGLDILGFYLLFVYNKYLMQHTLHLSATYIDIYNMFLLLCLWPIIVMFAKLSDAYGCRKILLFSGVLFTIMICILPWCSLYTLIPMLLMLGSCYGSLPVWMVERFQYYPAKVGLSFNIAAACFNILLSILAPISVNSGIHIFKGILMMIGLMICSIVYMDQRI